MRFSSFVDGFKVLSLGAVVVFASACGANSRWQRSAVTAASLEHDCPEESIQMQNFVQQGYSATAVMNVCGSRRVYRDFGGQTSFAWAEVTPNTSGN